MSRKREPLPYPHDDSDWEWPRTLPWACQIPESWLEGYAAAGSTCPGCAVRIYAEALVDPYATFHAGDGRWTSMLEAARHDTDDFDPMRVLFERALAARVIPPLPEDAK